MAKTRFLREMLASVPAKSDVPTCEWFALCANDSAGTIKHPILGDVPCCQRCADKLEMTDRLEVWE